MTFKLGLSTLAYVVKRKLKRWLFVLVLAFVAGMIALNLLAYRHACAMMHFTAGNSRTHEPEGLTLGQKCKVLLCGVQIPRPQTLSSVIDLGPPARFLRLDGTNAITLGAWYCPGSIDKPLVILFHGYTGEKSGTLPEAKVFLEMGYPVLLVDFRGSGDSSESYTTIGYDEAEDVASAVHYAHAHLPHRRVILYGQSMGGAAILRAVQDCGVQPDAIIVEAVFDEMLNTVKHRFEAMGVPSFPSAQLLVFWGGYQAGFNAFAHNPVHYAASVHCPILFLHGAADPRARLEEARRVFAAVSAPKRFKEFSAVGHAPTVVRYPDEWKETVSQFLREAEQKRIP